MEIKKLGNISGAFEIILSPHRDNRGFFVRTYDHEIFKKNGIYKNWVQENQSLSLHKFTLRGLHFQHPPSTESKLVRISRGEAFFVFVDLRRNSPTLGKWDTITLSEHNNKILLTPRGCAQGMCTLTENCVLHYHVDNFYSPEYEDVIRWDDPDLNIQWPTSTPTIISERDQNGKTFKEFIDQHDGLDI